MPRTPRSVAVMLVCLLLPLSPYAQERKERIIKKVSNFAEPVEIVEIQVGGQPVSLLGRFASDKDWLKTLTLKVKNVSGQSITYVEIGITIPKFGLMEYPFSVPLKYGQEPPQPGEISNAPTPKPIAPGHTVKLSLADSMYDRLTNYLSEKQAEDVESIELSDSLIYFVDGTAWTHGRILDRDPDNPRRWNVRGKPSGRPAKQGVPSTDPPGSEPPAARAKPPRIDSSGHRNMYLKASSRGAVDDPLPGIPNFIAALTFKKYFAATLFYDDVFYSPPCIYFDHYDNQQCGLSGSCPTLYCFARNEYGTRNIFDTDGVGGKMVSKTVFCEAPGCSCS